MKAMLICAITAFFLGGYGHARASVIDESSDHLLNEEAYVFFSHNSSLWDRKLTTKLASRKLKQWAKSIDLPMIQAVHSFKKDGTNHDSYFITQKDIATVVKTVGGAHDLKTPKLQRIFLSGGYLEWCLCESLRDIARGSDFSAGPVNIYLVFETIYTNSYNIWVHRPSYPSSRTIALTEAVKNLNHSQVSSMLKSIVFNTKENIFCDIQYTNRKYKKESLKLSEFEVEIFKDSKSIDIIGSGKKEIKVHLISVNDLNKVI
ncbi:MAG: hypothetical protein HOE90_13410 [Bacteriovoracaceae bacterium]|jgi:hypothetical protein|nr:hypothetical protein [Bacteriovoracaceae bacterium]